MYRDFLKLKEAFKKRTFFENIYIDTSFRNSLSLKSFIHFHAIRILLDITWKKDIELNFQSFGHKMGQNFLRNLKNQSFKTSSYHAM